MPSDSARLVLVTGATGKQGGSVVRHLHQKGFRIRALTRDPDKPEARALVGPGIEVMRGDLQQPDTLSRALDGVYGVYSVQNSLEGPESEMRQGFALIEAAQRSRVSHFVQSSVAGVDQQTGIPHFESKARIEERLRASGIPFTIFRPVFFMENLLALHEAAASGYVSLPLSPETKLQMISVGDIGAFVSLAFEHSGKWQGVAMDLAGDDVSMTELARGLSRVVGRDVAFRQMSWDEAETHMPHRRVIMYRWLEDVGHHIDISAVRSEYPQLCPLPQWLDHNWPAFSR